MKRFLVALLLLFPSVALAAGFATQSIFLSQSPVTVGNTVRVHATISNDAATSFSGSVSLLDGPASLGSVPVTLPAGAAVTISANWTPQTSGTHNITARLVSSAGATIQETSANFDVLAPPAPSADAGASQSASVQSSQQIQNDIAQYSPQAAQAAQPAFSTVDSLRSDAANFLNNQLATTKKSLAGAPEVLGTSTVAQAQSNPAGTFWFVLKTLYLYVLTVLLFLINNAAVFYPLLVIIFFYILWRLFRRVRRPTY